HDPHGSPVAVSPPPPSPLVSTSVSFHCWSTMSVISPCHLRDEVLSFLVPFGDARACGKIGCGRSPRSVVLGAVSPFLSLIRGADGGAAHCRYEHEGPTLDLSLFGSCGRPRSCNRLRGKELSMDEVDDADLV